MSALLRCPSQKCHWDDTRISTRNKPSLSVTYSKYNECTFGPRASKRFPLWSVHRLDEKPTHMSFSSSCLIEIGSLESSSTLSRCYARACRRAGPRGSQTGKRWRLRSRPSLVRLCWSRHEPGDSGHVPRTVEDERGEREREREGERKRKRGAARRANNNKDTDSRELISIYMYRT